MRMLLWDVDNHFVVDQYGEIQLDTKPDLSFDFVAIRYVENGEFWLIDSNSARNDLGSEQVLEIHDYIKSQRDAYGIKVMAVDVHGEWLGWVDQSDPRIDSTVTEFPPTDDEWNWCNGQWLRVWYIDSVGRIVDKSKSVERVFSNQYPQHHTDIWSDSTESWVSTQSSEIYKLEGLHQLIGVAIDTIDKKTLDRRSAMLEMIEAMVNVAEKHMSELDHIKFSTSIDVIADEILTYCDTPNDVQLSVSNLALYT